VGEALRDEARHITARRGTMTKTERRLFRAMAEINQKQIIVMTGATGGIGAQALKRIAPRRNTEIVVGARGGRDLPGATVLPLELDSLQSVRDFAQAVKEHLGGTKIDVLVLNAGAQFRQAERSADGFEMTFAVNHLSHYLLARLLLPEMAEGGRIVITTSDTHDPSKMPLGPRTLDPESLAHPTKDSPARAYPASKLSNLLTARSLAASHDVRSGRSPSLRTTRASRVAPRWAGAPPSSRPSWPPCGPSSGFSACCFPSCI